MLHTFFVFLPRRSSRHAGIRITMARVIYPVDLIKKYLNDQRYKQNGLNENEKKVLHQGIVMGAAILKNDLDSIDEPVIIEPFLGKRSNFFIALEAIKRVEESLDCYADGPESNQELLQAKLKDMLILEEETGYRQTLIN